MIKLNSNGFTLIELIIVITILAFVISLLIPVFNINMSNIQKKQIHSKLLGNFMSIESAFNNYMVDKNAYPVASGTPANMLNDNSFVPSYLMIPSPPDGFDTTYGLNGFLVNAKTDANPKGYYICAKVDVTGSSDLKYIAIKEISQKVSQGKYYYNTTCPAGANMADPTGAVSIYPTYWILRL